MLNFTVGPVMSAPEVIEIANRSTPYFRTPEFSEVMLENERLMLDLLNAPLGSRCVFLTSSGTGAMESCVMNLLRRDDRTIVINGGSFGQRFVDLCALHERAYTEIRLPFGKQVSREQLWEFSGKGYTALLVNMDETSSGVLYDMPMIASFCRENGIFLIVDAISAFLSDELDMTELDAAAVITGSQKALAVQPGVSVVALSPAALERVRENPEVTMYLSLKSALKNGERGQTPFTPAVTTLLQINRRLQMIADAGIASVISGIAAIAEDFRAQIAKTPLSFVAESKSNAVTALYAPKENAGQIVAALKDEYGIWVCPNGGELKDRVFRVGHIGYITPEDNGVLIGAFKELCARGIL